MVTVFKTEESLLLFNNISKFSSWGSFYERKNNTKQSDQQTLHIWSIMKFA